MFVQLTLIANLKGPPIFGFPLLYAVRNLIVSNCCCCWLFTDIEELVQVYLSKHFRLLVNVRGGQLSTQNICVFL